MKTLVSALALPVGSQVELPPPTTEAREGCFGPVFSRRRFPSPVGIPTSVKDSALGRRDLDHTASVDPPPSRRRNSRREGLRHCGA